MQNLAPLFTLKVKEFAAVPIFANGHCFNIEDVNEWKETKVDGLMSARGLLENPALFQGHNITPAETISDWITLGLSYGVPTHIFHQHLMMMLYRVHNKEGPSFSSIRALTFDQKSGYLMAWGLFLRFWITSVQQDTNSNQVCITLC